MEIDRDDNGYRGESFLVAGGSYTYYLSYLLGMCAGEAMRSGTLTTYKYVSVIVGNIDGTPVMGISYRSAT